MSMPNAGRPPSTWVMFHTALVAWRDTDCSRRSRTTSASRASAMIMKPGIDPISGARIRRTVAGPIFQRPCCHSVHSASPCIFTSRRSSTLSSAPPSDATAFDACVPYTIHVVHFSDSSSTFASRGFTYLRAVASHCGAAVRSIVSMNVSSSTRNTNMSQSTLPFGVSAAACIPSPGWSSETSLVTRPLSASAALGPRNVLHWPADSNQADSRRRST